MRKQENRIERHQRDSMMSHTKALTHIGQDHEQNIHLTDKRPRGLLILFNSNHKKRNRKEKEQKKRKRKEKEEKKPVHRLPP